MCFGEVEASRVLLPPWTLAAVQTPATARRPASPAAAVTDYLLCDDHLRVSVHHQASTRGQASPAKPSSSAGRPESVRAAETLLSVTVDDNDDINDKNKKKNPSSSIGCGK